MSAFIAGYGVLPNPQPQPQPIFHPEPIAVPAAAEPPSPKTECASSIQPTVAASEAATPLAVATSAVRDDESQALAAASADEFLNTQFPPREMVLAPILPSQGLAMVYSRRGVGKTYLTLAIAHAVARGGNFLRWSAPRARRVLFVDGELPAPVLQQRLRTIVSGLPKTEPHLPDSGYLRIITPDLQRGAMPDIATARGQAMIESRLEGGDLLVLDNLSCLARSGKENEGESWIPVQDWALRLRQKGVCVLFLHHAGKGGQQRGTSRREDLLDTVIALRQPDDYCATEGLRAQVRFEKARGFFGEDARPFEVRMEIREGAAVWAVSFAEPKPKLTDPLLDNASELFAQGFSVRDVAERLGVSKSRVGRLREAWDSED
ncbi:MAG TPA: AAA family ATPase [Terriglobales bacterium]|nr:AAA family ATPase [Terriglobales bacterium]